MSFFFFAMLNNYVKADSGLQEKILSENTDLDLENTG